MQKVFKGYQVKITSATFGLSVLRETMQKAQVSY